MREVVDDSEMRWKTLAQLSESVSTGWLALEDPGQGSPEAALGPGGKALGSSLVMMQNTGGYWLQNREDEWRSGSWLGRGSCRVHRVRECPVLYAEPPAQHLTRSRHIVHVPAEGLPRPAWSPGRAGADTARTAACSPVAGGTRAWTVLHQPSFGNARGRVQFPVQQGVRCGAMSCGCLLPGHFLRRCFPSY